MIDNSDNLICIFTGLPVKMVSDKTGNYFYFLKLNNKNFSYQIDLRYDIENSEFFSKNKHVLKEILLNGIWPWTNAKNISNDSDLQKIISESNPPQTPNDKIENLFLYLFKIQNYEGERLNSKIFNNLSPEYFYFRNGAEQDFYLKTLFETGYLEKFGNAVSDYAFQVSYEGLQHALELEEFGKHSMNCFVAMSFNPELLPLREAIKHICIQNGFNPILIDEQKIEYDQTINDAIIKSIKKSKFCIADFTEQKNGVYFEAGYALGKGMPVIYLCQEDNFKESHFDTNHFPHLIYKSTEELKRKLDDRIKAWLL